MDLRHLRLMKKQVKRLFILLYKDTTHMLAKISLDRLANKLRRSRLYSTRLLRFVLTLSICYSITHSVIHSVSFLLPSSFIYLNAVLHSRVVGQSLHIIIQSRQITLSRQSSNVNDAFPRLSFVSEAMCPNMRIRTSVSPIISFSYVLP
jgi:hypothetical protein